MYASPLTSLFASLVCTATLLFTLATGCGGGAAACGCVASFVSPLCVQTCPTFIRTPPPAQLIPPPPPLLLHCLSPSLFSQQLHAGMVPTMSCAVPACDTRHPSHPHLCRHPLLPSLALRWRPTHSCLPVTCAVACSDARRCGGGPHEERCDAAVVRRDGEDTHTHLRAHVHTNTLTHPPTCTPKRDTEHDTTLKKKAGNTCVAGRDAATTTLKQDI